MNCTVVIPARLGSSRLPAKPLADIHGRPLIVHVLERARESGAQRVIVATDHPHIRDAVHQAGGEALLTAGHHRSGSERVAEVTERLGLDDDAIVINLQGDEPLMPPELIRRLHQALKDDPDGVMATAATPLETTQALFDPHTVKVVCDHSGHALYFSRAPLPWAREAFAQGAPQVLPDAGAYRRHIGLYAYRAGFLRRFTAWPESPLERLESLEQLRALWHGARIRVIEAPEPPGPGVDTPEDLERVRQLLAP